MRPVKAKGRKTKQCIKGTNQKYLTSLTIGPNYQRKSQVPSSFTIFKNAYDQLKNHVAKKKYELIAQF